MHLVPQNAPWARGVVPALLIVALASATGHAALVGFNAEDFDSTSDGSSGPGFVVIPDGNAMGNAVIDFTGDEDLDGTPTFTATYTVTIPTADTYELYARLSVLADVPGDTTNDTPGNNDSFYVPSDPLRTTGTAGGTFLGTYIAVNTINAFFDGAGEPDFGQYVWVNLTEKSSNNAPPYTLDAGEHTFIIGGREDGLYLDAFVFASADLSDDAADFSSEIITQLTTAVPEPASLVLLVAGTGLIACRRPTA